MHSPPTPPHPTPPHPTPPHPSHACLQKGTRIMQHLCNEGKYRKDMNLTAKVGLLCTAPCTLEGPTTSHQAME
jgi:hypothetical protein